MDVYVGIPPPPCVRDVCWETTVQTLERSIALSKEEKTLKVILLENWVAVDGCQMQPKGARLTAITVKSHPAELATKTQLFKKKINILSDSFAAMEKYSWNIILITLNVFIIIVLCVQGVWWDNLFVHCEVVSLPRHLLVVLIKS